MLLSTKHANQQTVSRYDFTGGLNSTTAIEMIADNQLASVVNMDIDTSTGLLKTVSGAKTVYTPSGITIKDALYDSINSIFLIIDTANNVYKCNLATHEKIGAMTGSLAPISTAWENGVLIASGAKLQYYNGTQLLTLAASPTTCLGVYIRAGRVLVDYDNEVRYSAIGNEEDWTENSNDSSTSKFVEAGYKDGGKFIGMTSLSSDVIIIKDNHRIYRLSGEYPNWSVKEISRNVDCVGRLSYCSVANSTLILGNNKLQVIQTTDDYGNMKATNVAGNISKELSEIPLNSRMIYVPPLNQVWIIGKKGKVIVYDLTCNSFFIRQFNSDVLNVISVNDDVYIIKADRISLLSAYQFYDDDEPLVWSFKARRIVGHNALLVKRVQFGITPHFERFCNGNIMVGGLIFSLPMPFYLSKIYKNKAQIYHNKTKICSSYKTRGIYASGDLIYYNPEPIYGNTTRIYTTRDITLDDRCVYRNRFIDIKGYGSAGSFILNKINIDLAEV